MTERLRTVEDSRLGCPDRRGRLSSTRNKAEFRFIRGRLGRFDRRDHESEQLEHDEEDFRVAEVELEEARVSETDGDGDSGLSELPRRPAPAARALPQKQCQ